MLRIFCIILFFYLAGGITAAVVTEKVTNANFVQIVFMLPLILAFPKKVRRES